jgi:asparagine synthase (glutamine-hydrolysing)
MLASLEVRCPLLDHRVVDFAYSLPDRLRYRSGIRKYVLKLIGRRILPRGFPFERKRGFSIPEGEWIRGRWKPMFEETLRSCPLLDPVAIRRLMDLHERNGRYGRLLFKLFALAVFQQNARLVFE